MVPLRPIFVISDLHIGDGTARDNFDVNDRKRELNLFLDHVEKEDGELVIIGDLFEFWQANLSKVIMRHKCLLNRFAEMNARYVVGNHDIDLAYFIKTGVLSLSFFNQMCGPFEREIGGKKFMFMHGHEVDPFCRGENPEFGRILAIFAGIVEDLNKSPVLESGETVEDVLAAAGDLFWTWLKSVFSFGKRKVAALEKKQELTPAQNPDRVKELYRSYREDKEAKGYDVAIVGHTHSPGRIGEWYFNSGSWVEKTNNFIRISESGKVDVFNWVEGRAELNTLELEM